MSGFRGYAGTFESLFKHRLVGDRIPPQLLKVYVDFILQGLEYFHSDCQIIHTGLLKYSRHLHQLVLTASLDVKADNILMSFEDPTVIEEYVKAQDDYPMPRERDGDRNIYLSHNNFGALNHTGCCQRLLILVWHSKEMERSLSVIQYSHLSTTLQRSCLGFRRPTALTSGIWVFL
jgi:hypothetical protein